MENITPKYNLIPKKEKIQVPVPYNESVDSGSLVGGWKATANELRKGKISLQGNNERILIGDASAPMTGKGIFQGKDGSDYEFRCGDPSGDYFHYDGTNCTYTGALIAGSIHIPDQDTTADSFHTNTTGNSWWGCTETSFNSDNDNANAYVLKTGVAKFQNVSVVGTISGRSTATVASAIDSSGHFIDANLNTSTKKILQDFAFEDTNYAGALKTGDVAWDTSTGRVTSGTGIVINDKGIMGALSGTEKFTLLTDGTATFAGALSAASGTFAGALSAVTGTFSGSLTVGTALDIRVDSNLPSDENLVGYWAFDEGQGSKAYDGSGNGNDGTLTNMDNADWVDGISGSALNFDGSAGNEYVEIPYDATLIGTEMSWVFWVKPTNLDRLEYLLTYAGTSMIRVIKNANNTLKITIRKSDDSADVNYTSTWTFPTADIWYHIGVTFSATNEKAKVYVNGDLKIDEDHTYGMREENSYINLGILWRDYSPLLGLMDEVCIYKNQILTAKEMYALYKNPSGQPSLALPLGRLTSGKILSKQITMDITAGAGDAFITFGKTDFGQDTTAGLIMGFDDSDSDKFKFEMTEGHIRTSTGTDRVEISSANNRIECYNTDVLVGYFGKTSADGSFIFYDGAESTKVPMIMSNTGTANIARFRQNNSNTDCDPAVFFESNASGGSYADSVITIKAGAIWNGSSWVANTSSTIIGLLIDNVGRGSPLTIDNNQPAGGNRYGALRLTTQDFVPNWGSAGMISNYNNYLIGTTKNHDDSSWISYKICRHENGNFALGTLTHAGAGTTVFTGTLTYADQFPTNPEPVITPETGAGNTTNITDVSVLLTNATTTTFSYWVRVTTSAALTAGFQLYWQAEETD